MAVLKCKMCGADLNVVEFVKITECGYCGSTQTVPTVNDEKRINLFNRANRLRLINEFDKAAAIYENIIAEFPEEAEAYWGLCLCNYGIEYVDDPLTSEKKPTCHRAAFTKLSADENFSLAMEYSDISAQGIYRKQAREIDEIMANILSVSKNEKPYDVFICYKETDVVTGERTVDSVLAYDIYDVLTAKGLKVFFARVTLEDKLGMLYEPYIFSALNSAKVMLCIGTKYENFHAVWVKNEWFRFLKLASKDKSKVLIPCFRDIEPCDLPDEFRMLQAQDLSKLGAIQDLTRGVLKIVYPDGIRAAEPVAAVPPVVHQQQNAAPKEQASSELNKILKRAIIYLEDGEFRSAEECFTKVLDSDPENKFAYLGKLMCQNEITKVSDFSKVYYNVEATAAYKRYMRFAEDNERMKIQYLRRIASENRRNLSLKPVGIRFETPDNMASVSDPYGYPCFSSSRVKTIRYYFEFENITERRLKLDVRWRIVSADNPNFIAWQQDSYVIKPGITYFSNGWAFENFGIWKHGRYTLLIVINGKETYQKSFYVD